MATSRYELIGAKARFGMVDRALAVSTCHFCYLKILQDISSYKAGWRGYNMSAVI